MTDSGPASLVELRFTQALEADPQRACEAFAEDGTAWLGTRVEGPNPGVRRYLSDLVLPVRAGAPRLEFKKAAFVDVGAISCRNDECTIHVSWRSASLAPLFPVFSGIHTVTRGEIRLQGYYAPPGGDVGLVLDKAFLSIAARGTARWFLGRVTAVANAGSSDPWPDTDEPATVSRRQERGAA